MYSIVNRATGDVLASNLTLNGVDVWMAHHERSYVSVRIVGMTLFVENT